MNYSFIDDRFKEETLYYRLKQTDYDGKFEYVGVLTVDCGLEEQMPEIQCFPNPIENELTVQYQNLITRGAVLSISNIYGKLMMIKTMDEMRDTGEFTLDLQELPPGVYLVNFNSENYTYSGRFVKL